LRPTIGLILKRPARLMVQPMGCGRVGTLSPIVRIDCAAQPVGFLRLHHAQEPNRY